MYFLLAPCYSISSVSNFEEHQTASATTKSNAKYVFPGTQQIWESLVRMQLFFRSGPFAPQPLLTNLNPRSQLSVAASAQQQQVGNMMMWTFNLSCSAVGEFASHSSGSQRLRLRLRGARFYAWVCHKHHKPRGLNKTTRWNCKSGMFGVRHLFAASRLMRHGPLASLSREYCCHRRVNLLHTFAPTLKLGTFLCVYSRRHENFDFQTAYTFTHHFLNPNQQSEENQNPSV